MFACVCSLVVYALRAVDFLVLVMYSCFLVLLFCVLIERPLFDSLLCLLGVCCLNVFCCCLVVSVFCYECSCC